MIRAASPSGRPLIGLPELADADAMTIAERLAHLADPAVRERALAAAHAVGGGLLGGADRLFVLDDTPDYEPGADQSVAARAARRAPLPSRTMPARRFVRTAVAAVVLAAATGCAGDGPTAEGPSAEATTSTSTSTTRPVPVEGLVAEIAPNRLYATQHALGLGLRNVGDAPVEVVSVQLDSGLFEPAAAGDEGAVLQTGGRRFVFPVPYGEAICDGATDEHVAVVTLADGREVRVPAVEEFAGAVARQHERECRAQEVRARADLRFGDEWERDGTAIHGELLLDQLTPGSPVEVVDLRGNVIFTLTADADDGDADAVDDDAPILAVDDERRTAAAAVTIDATRCDPHAVAEFKTPFVMLSWVSVGDGEPVAVELVATGPAQTAVEELIAACSTG